MSVGENCWQLLNGLAYKNSVKWLIFSQLDMPLRQVKFIAIDGHLTCLTFDDNLKKRRQVVKIVWAKLLSKEENLLVRGW